jgi:sugar (pentulose or hexulose) kinase
VSLVIGIDVGTSGVRAAACDPQGRPLAVETAPLPVPPEREGRIEQDAALWWQATVRALEALLSRIDRAAVRALAVDGTSGTVLAIDRNGIPLAPGRLYNDRGAVREAARIAAAAPPTSGAHGATSGLAKALQLAAETRPHRILHQADWVAGRLSGRFDVSDENNALKTGYDPVARAWPDFVEALGLDPALLPAVVAPGTAISEIGADQARAFGLTGGVIVAAGTTDGCASFLATGADAVGDAVTALGTTLTLKVLAAEPVFDPSAGVYSHRLGDHWLAGGASNTGGAVLAAQFTAKAMRDLEARLDPDRETGLDYYPLPRPGERFPVADPALSPRLEPRPDDDARFFQGLLEGIARIEAQGYRRLKELGGPSLRRVLTVGGGARNEAWTRIRARLLRAPVERAASEEAAIGAARLARIALERPP